jgi:hypothetical protein
MVCTLPFVKYDPELFATQLPVGLRLAMPTRWHLVLDGMGLIIVVGFVETRAESMLQRNKALGTRPLMGWFYTRFYFVHYEIFSVTNDPGLNKNSIIIISFLLFKFFYRNLMCEYTLDTMFCQVLLSPIDSNRFLPGRIGIHHVSPLGLPIERYPFYNF